MKTFKDLKEGDLIKTVDCSMVSASEQIMKAIYYDSDRDGVKELWFGYPNGHDMWAGNQFDPVDFEPVY